MSENTAEKILALEKEGITKERRIQGLYSKFRGIVSIDDVKLEYQTEYKEFIALKAELEKIVAEIEYLQIILKIEKAHDTVKNFIPLAKSVADMFKGDVIEAISESLSIVASVHEGINEQMSRLSRIGAEDKFRRLTQLVSAGFTTEQAMAILLNEGSTTQLIINKLVDSAPDVAQKIQR